jgi:hypothetical protein
MTRYPWKDLPRLFGVKILPFGSWIKMRRVEVSGVFLASDADSLSYFFAQLPHPDDGWTVVATCRGTRLTAMNMCVFDTTLDGRLHGPIGAVTTRARWAHPITRREADYSA